MTEQRSTWASREERRISPTPTKIPPHPELEGYLPPCETSIQTGKPCPRPAAWHYGYGYYCDEHIEVALAGEEEDEAGMAVYHAKRFLWRARVEGLESLELYLSDALARCAEDLQRAEKNLEELKQKADA